MKNKKCTSKFISVQIIISVTQKLQCFMCIKKNGVKIFFNILYSVGVKIVNSNWFISNKIVQVAII